MPCLQNIQKKLLVARPTHNFDQREQMKMFCNGL